MPRSALFCYSQSHAYGGSEVVGLLLAEHWPGEGVRILWRQANDAGWDRYLALAGRRSDIHVRQTRLLDLERIDSALSAQGVPRWLVRWVVHAAHPALFLGYGGWFAVRLHRAQPAVFLSNSGGFPGGVLNLAALLGAWLARVPRRVFIAHNYPASERGLGRLYGALLDRLIGSLATHVVTVSTDCARSIAEARALGRQVSIVRNGIVDHSPEDLLRAEARRVLGARDQDDVIGIIGHVEERKGHHVLVAALPTILVHRPRARLVFVGREDAGYGRALRAQAKDLGVAGRVSFLGFLLDGDRCYRGLDVVCMPSLRWESFGLVALEAALRGLPVIASNAGALPEVVQHEATGLIVPAGDAAGLAAAIVRVLEDPILARRLGDTARQRVLDEFTAARMAKEYARLVGLSTPAPAPLPAAPRPVPIETRADP